MVKIFSNSDYQISNIYKNCIIDGDIHILKESNSLNEIINYSKNIIYKHFNGLQDVQRAQEKIDVKDYVEIIMKIKNDFTNSIETDQLMASMLQKLNLQNEDIFFDKPKIRVATYNKYLESGAGYVFKPHRDSWYAGPISQLNFWFPIFDIDLNSTFAIYPNYWGKKILNSSENFDYDLWKEKFRYTANKHIKTDTRNHPLALEEVDKSNEFRIDCSAGDLVVFSGCHLHGTIPNVSNKTRFSIDFRIISKDLFERNVGINIDSKSIGSTISDFKNSLNLKNYSLSNNK
ncbi:phytanoyl-CoA dioxygenase family protein [Candidatus Pelagibacter sp.]|nr:phytanoyl-CoA dioxygenase family protein [Candidatus Pelagibacter sp.]